MLGPWPSPKGKKCAPPDQGGFYRDWSPSMVDPPKSEDVPGYPVEEVAPVGRRASVLRRKADSAQQGCWRAVPVR